MGNNRGENVMDRPQPATVGQTRRQPMAQILLTTSAIGQPTSPLLCFGELVLVEACIRGFLSFEKYHILSHNFVDLLQQHSGVFDKSYDDLMRIFTDLNKFDNLPFGFRANSWLISPPVAQSPLTFPPLLVKDKTWGGNGGGLRRVGRSDLTRRANESQFVVAMSCKNVEERPLLDRKALILHSLFVNVAIFRATSTL
ncbi:hypothetical protein Nepgr_012827 [Nepenthes gracilis]|uniref:Uncharacterized protein n=1 Tax=Nepenthes gracilis TaxID=150966 RepID=A0AAD3SHT8_NEPGR|nr:hypothetical protein Nepgr_012827 [Nepenthes gracilis]